MKRIICLLTAWAAVACAAYGEPLPAEKVPAVVRDAFRAKFPDVIKVEWKLKEDKNYEAEFKQKDVEVAAKFDEKGKWLETETAIKESDLPEKVRTRISKDYKAYEQIETQKVERAGAKPILYEVHLENAEEILKVQLKADGSIASKSSKPKKSP